MPDLLAPINRLLALYDHCPGENKFYQIPGSQSKCSLTELIRSGKHKPLLLGPQCALEVLEEAKKQTNKKLGLECRNAKGKILDTAGLSG